MTYQTLKKAIALLTPREKKRGFLVLILVIGMALFETVGIASVMPFLAILGNPELIDTNRFLSSLYSVLQNVGINTLDGFLIVLGLGAFTLIILSAVYRTVTHYAMSHYIQMREHSLGTRLLETYLRHPYEFFLDRHSGDMSTTILSEVSSVVGNVFRPAYNMVAYSLVLIAITTLLLIVNPWLALLAAGVLSGLYTLIFLGLKQKLSSIGGILVSANKERFMAAGEAFGGIKDLKLLGRELHYVNRFETHSHQYASVQALYQISKQVPHYLIEAMILGTMLLLTVILMISAGGLGSQALGQILPILGVYAFAAYRLKPAVQNIYQGFASLRFGQAAVDSLSADLRSYNSSTPLPASPPAPLKAKNRIALENLSYVYPNTDKRVLIDLNLQIPVASSIGLVGSTGAGKTTLVDVLLGLLRPTQGAITVDGVPVSNAQLRSWQQSLGYVPQEIYLTDTSIAENIALGIPKAQIDQPQVEHCARMAQVHDFIVKDLPAQYQTLVGERGVRLSGGQRQRIGIARALYHNPEILVFDEATSALDTVTEQAVMDAIDALAHQKTIIMIAHRLSTVKNCDQIIILDQGKFESKGTYDELLDRSIKFKTMVNS